MEILTFLAIVFAVTVGMIFTAHEAALFLVYGGNAREKDLDDFFAAFPPREYYKLTSAHLKLFSPTANMDVPFELVSKLPYVARHGGSLFFGKYHMADRLGHFPKGSKWTKEFDAMYAEAVQGDVRTVRDLLDADSVRN